MKKIKILDKSWIERIFEIEKKSFSSPWTKRFFLNLFDEENVFVYGFFLNKDLIGFSVIEYLINYSIAHLQNFAINPEYQNKGFGSYFLSLMHENFKKNKIYKIFLEVRVTNYKAINLYEKFNYKTINTLSDYYENNEDAYRMWFNLEN